MYDEMTPDDFNARLFEATSTIKRLNRRPDAEALMRPAEATTAIETMLELAVLAGINHAQHIRNDLPCILPEGAWADVGETILDIFPPEALAEIFVAFARTERGQDIARRLAAEVADRLSVPEGQNLYHFAVRVTRLI